MGEGRGREGEGREREGTEEGGSLTMYNGKSLNFVMQFYICNHNVTFTELL